MAGAADDLREQIERWFTKQGLPLFIQSSGFRPSLEGRLSLDEVIRGFAAVWIIEVLVLAPIRDYPFQVDLLALVAGLAIFVRAGPLTYRLLTNLPPPVGLGFGALFFVVTPALVPVIFGRQLLSASVTASGNLGLVILVLLLLISGLLPLTGWAIRETWRQTSDLLKLLAGALPVLFVAVMILFLTAEVWQMAARLKGPFLLIIFALFVILGTLCLLRGLVSEVKKRCNESTDDCLRKLAERLKKRGSAGRRIFKDLEDLETKIRKKIEDLESRPETAPAVLGIKLSRRQTINIGLVLLFSMSLQIVAVSVAVGLMFLIFGALAIPASTVQGFLGGPDASPPTLIAHVPSVTLWDQHIELTRELGYVTAFITLFSYLSFVFYVVTNEKYIEQFLEQVDEGVYAALVVREIYLTTIWPPRLERSKHGNHYWLTFEVPTALVQGSAVLHGRRDSHSPAASYTRYELEKKDGCYTRRFELPAGTDFHYYYEIDGQAWKGLDSGTGAVQGIPDPSGTSELILPLPSRTAKVAVPATA